MKWLIILLAPLGLFATYDISICAIFKNEATYLKEWIEFHKLQGVDHFYLYNNDSSDDYLEVLDPYIKQEVVTLTQWCYSYHVKDHRTWIQIQTGAYNDCLLKALNKSSWIAFIDIDEFLFCPKGEKLSRFLEDYKDFGGLGVNWLTFGTSFLEEIPEGALMIEALTCCDEPSNKINSFFKSIIQPAFTKAAVNAHCFKYQKDKFAVTADKKKLGKEEYSSTFSHDKIRINHYWTRTEKYFRENKLASLEKRRSKADLNVLLNMAKSYNSCTNFDIQQFVPDLKQAMQEQKSKSDLIESL